MLLVLALALAATPAPDAVATIGQRTMGPAVGDVDGDGIQDVVYTHTDDVVVWRGQAGSAPADPADRYEASGSLRTGIVAGDVDGDGIDDVLTVRDPVVAGPASELEGWQGHPGGLVQAWAGTPAPSRYLHELGDVDGDGRHDVLADLTVWGGSPTGPTAGGPFPSGLDEAPRRVWPLGDLNGDGYDDVALRGEEDAITWYGASVASLIVLQGSPTGLDPIPLWTYGREGLDCGADVARADVDGDGVDELVVICLQAMDESGYGAFDVLDDIGTAAPVQVTTTSFSADLGSGLGVGSLDDWDGDGRDEVLIAANGEVRTAPWDAATGLVLDDPDATVFDLSLFHHPAQLVTGDVSGDGRDDLIVRWYDHSADEADLAVWLGPLGTLPPETGDTGTPATTAPGGTGDTGDTDADGPDEDDGDEGSDGEGCGCRQSAAAPSWWAPLATRRR